MSQIRSWRFGAKLSYSETAMTMKAHLIALALLAPTISLAGSFKRVTVDGKYEDWAGVPVVVSDEEDSGGQFDFKEVFLANDDQFLYLLVRLHQPSAYSKFHHHVVLDTDADSSTGLAWLGLGSELMIEDGASYQQKNGQFNEGAGSELFWKSAPTGTITQFEARISLAALDGEGKKVFTGKSIVVSLESRDLDWQLKDALEAIPYELASTPPPFKGSKTLLTLDTSEWRFLDSAEPKPEWKNLGFSPEGWKTGAGLFGYGAAAGVYPKFVKSALAAGRAAYSFRVPFPWTNDSHVRSSLSI